MAIQVQGDNGTLLRVGGPTFMGAHAHLKPLDYSSPGGNLGHYRTALRVVLSAAQAANSRLFEIRNTGSNLLVPTMIDVSVLPIGGVATAYWLALDLYRCLSFSTVDTINTATPTSSTLRTSGMSAYPGNAQVRYLTPAGHAAGMTGGTMTKEAFPLASLIAWMASVSATSQPVVKQLLGDPARGAHPPVFAQNEGFVIENALAGSATTNQILMGIDISWAEVTAY